jgi:hypothetical protein
MIDPTTVARLSFARGLIVFAWASIAVLGPLALLLTWYGDCFAEVCPSASTTDRLLYSFDAIAWIAVGIIGIVGRAHPPRGTFVVLGLLGLAFAGQGIAGLVGARSFYAFGIILPAAALVTIGSAFGAFATSARLRWAEPSLTSALTVGCATYVVSFFGFFGLASAASGQIVGLLLAVAVVAAVGIEIALSRRTARRRHIEPRDTNER